MLQAGLFHRKRVREIKVVSRGEVRSFWSLAMVLLSLTVLAQPADAQAGLAAHWKLDDGSGPTAGDSSGNGNSGALQNGPTWTAGQVGGALSLDGVDDYVDIPNSPSLSPTGAITLAAWVNSRAPASGVVQMILGKYSGAVGGPYFLRIQGSGVVRFGVAGTNLTGARVLNANTWYHVAATYDGAQMRLYVNGALDGSVAKTGAMTDNGLNVNIGQLVGSGGSFNGLLDDVRVYDRGLSAAEVLGVYDTSPPTVPTNLSATAVSPTQVNLTWSASTDNTSVTGYKVYRDGVEVATVSGLSYPDTGRSPATTYMYTVAAVDGANNVSAQSAPPVPATTHAIDTTPPFISGVAHSQITMSGATITWNTDEPANSVVDYGPTPAYGSTSTDPALVLAHSRTLSNLSPGTTCYYRVKSTDAAGNPSMVEGFSFTTAAPSSGLGGHWKLDEVSGSTAGDSSGNANNGALQNGPTWTAGVVSGALNFDGVDDYVSIPNHPSLSPTTSITLSAWVNPRAPASGAIQMILGKYSGASGGPYFLRIQGDGVARFGVAGTNLTGNRVLTAAWNLVTATWDGAQMRLYINGVLDVSVAKTGAMTDNGLNVAIGQLVGSGGAFNGFLDDVRLYGLALSAQEVLDLYNAGAPPGGPSLTGQWSGPFTWPLVAVHMALTHTGEVLLLDGEPVHGGASAQLWNPTTNTFTPVPHGASNMFCGGHAALADGRILVAGGHINNFVGTSDLNIFDPVTRAWTVLPAMAFPRWYPTVTTLPDGRALIISGNTTCKTCWATIPEIYDPVTNTVSQLPGASQTVPYYSFMFVLPNGLLVNAGASDPPAISTQTLDVANQSWALVNPSIFAAWSAVMYLPGKVMKSGSNTYVLDMTQPAPAWRQTAAKNVPRDLFSDLTILPDGTVLVTGGNTAAGPVLDAEAWSPVTETWTKWAAMQVERSYHSTALLLPDGRVVTAGGGRNPGQADRLSAEIFSPPYLFKGARPTISSVSSTTIPYNSAFSIVTPDAASIAKVSLIRTGAVTHSFDENQRFLNLSFTQNAGSLDVQAPANANLAPPGYYMLFILNTNGVPSIARFVKLQ